MKKVSLVCALLLLLFASMTAQAQADNVEEQEEPEIVKFKNLISIKTSLGYNYMIFQQMSPVALYQTNRPLDFGIGLGIKNIFLGYSMSIPFLYNHNFKKSQSLDFHLNYYRKEKWFSNGYIKYYNGFNNRTDFDNIDLKILNIGYLHEFITNQDHSIRSVYTLDGKQSASNGSFLIGGGLFFTSIQSGYDMLDDYAERQNAFYFGPNFGYSYTFVTRNNFFLNVLATLGACGIVSGGEFSVGLQILPRVSAGYHSKTWSMNVAATFSHLLDSYNEEMEYSLISGDINIAFVKRFF